MKLAKWLRVTTLVMAAGLLGACGSGNVDEQPKMEMTLGDGCFVMDVGPELAEGEGLLAIGFTVKNNTEEKATVNVSDFSVYDEAGDKVDLVDVGAIDSDFGSFEGDGISSGKTVKGNLVFAVDKAQEYELEYESVEGETEIFVISPEEYVDETALSTELAKYYVENVFLGKKSEAAIGEAVLSNDLPAETEAFKQGFREALREEFTEYKPSDDELNTVINSFMGTNGQKAVVNYKILQSFPDSAVITVMPECLNFEKVNGEAILENFLVANEVAYEEKWDQIGIDAEKHLLAEYPNAFNHTPISAMAEGSGDSLQIRLKKQDGKWQVITEDTDDNYAFTMIKQTFRGDLYL